MVKVSVIVPNYNKAHFVEQCLRSIISQKYPNKEIIIVDDGSTDNSLDIIKTFIKNNGSENIRLICQDNLNAAIARNRGMELASGDYVLFLDSDDILKDGAIELLVDACVKNKADLVIGNYVEKNEIKDTIRKRPFISEDSVVEKDSIFSKIVNLSPVPSNKLYSLELIRNNELKWGNVRIGQDLDFYLKYLSICRRVALIKDYIYQYRISKKSMSLACDFRILDITNVFPDVKKFYEKKGALSLYDSYIPPIALEHYNFQIEKQVFYRKWYSRLLIVLFFSVNEKELDYSKCKNDSLDYKKIRFRFRLRCIFRLLFTSPIYCFYKTREKR